MPESTVYRSIKVGLTREQMHNNNIGGERFKLHAHVSRTEGKQTHQGISD